MAKKVGLPLGQEQLIDRVRANFETRAGEAELASLQANDRYNKARGALRIAYRALEEMHSMAARVANEPETFKPENFRKVAAYLEQSLAEIRGSGLL